MTTPPPALPSLRLIFDLARSSREEMRAHFEAADTKAGIVLAFNGILIPLAKDIEGSSRTIGVILSGLSALAAFWAYWPREFPIMNEVELRKYLTWPEEEAYAEIGDTLLAMVTKSKAEIKTKTRRFKIALALLLSSIVTLGIGVISIPGKGEVNEQPKQSPPAVQQSSAPASKSPRAAPSES